MANKYKEEYEYKYSNYQMILWLIGVRKQENKVIVLREEAELNSRGRVQKLDQIEDWLKQDPAGSNFPINHTHQCATAMHHCLENTWQLLPISTAMT